MQEKKGFIIYCDQIDVFKSLSNEQLGELFRAFLDYNALGVLPDIKDNFVKFAFEFYKVMFDRDNQRYQEKCTRNSENARKRWDATVCDGMRTDANGCERSLRDRERDRDREKKRGRDRDIPPTPQGECDTVSSISSVPAPYSVEKTKYSKEAYQIPPTEEMVREYAKKVGGLVDPELFISQYEGVDWMVNGSPMKNWQAVYDAWNKKEMVNAWKRPLSDPKLEAERKRILECFDEKDESKIRMYCRANANFEDVFQNYFLDKYKQEFGRPWQY